MVTPWGVFSGTDAPGKDLECVERYDGMIRGHYTEDKYDDGSYSLSIVYYKAGDVFDDAMV